VSEVRIKAESRTEFGKGPARRTRAAGKVPAVLYGHGDKPRHFALPGHELMLALKHDSNVLLYLQTDDGEQLALPKVVERDPLKRTLTHVDLVAVTRGETVIVDVPLTLVGTA
jgi:large subunit ribosomal protein L25